MLPRLKKISTHYLLTGSTSKCFLFLTTSLNFLQTVILHRHFDYGLSRKENPLASRIISYNFRLVPFIRVRIQQCVAVSSTVVQRRRNGESSSRFDWYLNR